jgi:hypothetical protein
MIILLVCAVGTWLLMTGYDFGSVRFRRSLWPPGAFLPYSLSAVASLFHSVIKAAHALSSSASIPLWKSSAGAHLYGLPGQPCTARRPTAIAVQGGPD